MSHRTIRTNLEMLLVAAISATRLSAGEPTDPTENHMGINVTFLSDYAGENALGDITMTGGGS